MKKVVFLINSIGSGGAETALFNVINGVPDLLKNKYEVHLVLLDTEQHMKKAPKNIVFHELNSGRSLFRSVRLFYALCKDIQPDIVVSFLVRANVTNCILKWLKVYSKSIICERMHMSSHLKSQFSGIKLHLASLLPTCLYRFSSSILGVSTGVTQDLIDSFSAPANKCKTIYNPYNIEKLAHLASQPLPPNLPENYMVNVGRLTKSKDQITLIKALHASKSPLHLIIVGQGELNDKLVSKVNELNLAERVHFTGYLSNPHPVVKGAKFFISTSRNEGFPNVMMEAMALGVPTVFTTCDSGPAEIAGNSYDFKASSCTLAKYNMLVPEGDVEAIADAISRMSELGIANHYASMAKQRSVDFTLVKIATEYWQEIIDVLHDPYQLEQH